MSRKGTHREGIWGRTWERVTVETFSISPRLSIGDGMTESIPAHPFHSTLVVPDLARRRIEYRQEILKSIQLFPKFS
jgi:hypothetical protein